MNKKWGKRILAMVLAVSLSAVTGCGSMLKKVVPPKQYEKSQVLDGNFTDFSDPQAILALYLQHYNSLIGDPNYKPYSALRGSIDIFGVRQEWSKFLINFQVVHFDEKRDQLIYSYQTTLLGSLTSNEDNKFGYTAKSDSSGTGGLGGLSILQDTSVKKNYGLVAVVGVYDRKTGVSRLIFLDEEKNKKLTAGNAGDGEYSLLVHYVNDTVCVLYRNKVQYYRYNEGAKDYQRLEKESYDLNGVFVSSSFVSSLGNISAQETDINQGGIIQPNSASNNYLTTYNTYQVLPLGDTVLTKEDQAVIDGFMKLAETKMPLKAINSAIKLLDQEALARMIEGAQIQGAELNYISQKDEAVQRAADQRQIALDQYWWDTSTPFFGEAQDSQGTRYSFNMNWAYRITLGGSGNRSYGVVARTHFVSPNVRYSNVDWGRGKFTIHDIQYKVEDGKIVPRWLQVAYSVDQISQEEAETVTMDNLAAVLSGLEASYATSLKGAARWLEVRLDVLSTQISQSVTVSEVQEIKSGSDIDRMIEQEKQKIKRETEVMNGRYHQKKDVTYLIENQNLLDLEAELARYESELEEAEEADAGSAEGKEADAGSAEGKEADADSADGNAAEKKAAGEKELNPEAKAGTLTAQFTSRADRQAAASAEAVAGTGDSGVSQGRQLIDCYRAVFNDQEQIKKQSQFLAASQTVGNNSYYSQLLTLMSAKYSNFEQRRRNEAEARKETFNEESLKPVREALDRMLKKQNLESSEQEGAAITDGISLVGNEEDRLFTLDQEADVNNWTTLKTEVEQNNENNRLIGYLKKNQDAILADLRESIADLNLLSDLAAETAAQVQLMSDLDKESEAAEGTAKEGTAKEAKEAKEAAADPASELSGALFTNGYQEVIRAYQSALDALPEIQMGLSKIQKDREAFYRAETDQVCISRYDEVVASEKLESLYQECDKMGKLIKTIYFGSADEDRREAQDELAKTDWRIDINVTSLQDQIVVSQVVTKIVTTVDSLWSATVLSAEDNSTDFLFFNHATNLKLGTMPYYEVSGEVQPPWYLFGTGKDREFGDYVSYKPSAEMNLAYRASAEGAFNAPSKLSGVEWARGINMMLMTNQPTGMNQVAFGQVHYSKDASPLDVTLMSQAESVTDQEGNKKPQKFQCNAVTNWDPEQWWLPRTTTALGVGRGTFDTVLRKETLVDYSSVYSDSKMTQEDAEENAKKLETAKVTTDVEIRNFLGQHNTLFLDNPSVGVSGTGFYKVSGELYFLEISLDEGVQLYSVAVGDPYSAGKETSSVKRLGTFTGSFKDLYTGTEGEYTKGCYFRAWWIPDGKTEYNSKGDLSGGYLVLMGLSPEDMAAAEKADAEAKKKEKAAKDAAADKKAIESAGENVGGIGQALPELTKAVEEGTGAAGEPTESSAATESTGEGAAESSAAIESTGESTEATSAGAESTAEAQSEPARRELVNDDIYHSRLYKIYISKEQMNACKTTAR